MASYNKTILLGNLTRAPELTQLTSGTALCKFSMAVNEKYKTKGGEDGENTLFIDVVAWGKLAEVCGQYLFKGGQCMVDGKLKLDIWDDKDGNKRSRIGLTAEKVVFIGKPKSTDSEPESGPDGDNTVAKSELDGLGDDTDDKLPF